jgi:DNA uptake protein ComE-like DNA-binding protein
MITVERPIIRHFKRGWLVALMVGVMSLGLAACGDATPVQPTLTPQVTVGAANTPVVSKTTATPGAGGGESATVVAESTATNESGAEAVSCAKLDLNKVTEDALMSTIPGFSSRMVREFMEYRPYASIRQFRQEIGKYVDANQVAEYEKYVYVPVAVNDADAETLMQLPGVDATVAAELMKSRPYASNEVFLAALGERVNEQQIAEVKCYLATNP